MTRPPPPAAPSPLDADALADVVAASFDPAGGRVAGPGAPCPDEGTLVALAEDRLPADVAEEVAAHVVRCGLCLEVCAAVRDVAREARARPAARSGDVGAGDAPLRRRWGWAPFAIAATLLLAFGMRWVRGPHGAPVSLASAWAAVTADTPALAAQGPLADAELRAAPSPLRGGLVLKGPVGTVLSTSVELDWEPVPGATAATVVVTDAAGGDVLRRTTDAPPVRVAGAGSGLRRGTAYVWTLTVQGPRGRVEAARAFRVADDATVAAWSALVDRAARLVPEDHRDEVLAHAALRLGLVEEAIVRAERAVARADTAATRALLAFARARPAPGGR